MKERVSAFWPVQSTLRSRCGWSGVSKWQEADVLREIAGKSTEGLKHHLENSAAYTAWEERPEEGFEQRSEWYFVSLQAKIMLDLVLIDCGKPREEQEVPSWEAEAVMHGVVRGPGCWCWQKQRWWEVAAS